MGSGSLGAGLYVGLGVLFIGLHIIHGFILPPRDAKRREH